MCPACLAAAAIFGAKTVTAGGLVLLVARKVRPRKRGNPATSPAVPAALASVQPGVKP